MTPGRTQRDLRRLRGEESAGFPKRRPSQPDQPPSSSLHPPLPQTSRTRGPPPTQWSRPFLPLPAGRPPPPHPHPKPARVLLSATPTSGLVSHNARRPPPRPLLTCPPGHVARPPARWALPRPPRPSLQPPRAPEPPRPLGPAAPRGNLSCPRGQPLESCPVWGLAPPQAQGGAPPPPSDLVSPSASPPAASPGPPAPRLLGPPSPPSHPARSSLVSPPPHACTSLPSGASLPLIWGAPVGEPASGLPSRSVELSSA